MLCVQNASQVLYRGFRNLVDDDGGGGGEGGGGEGEGGGGNGSSSNDGDVVGGVNSVLATVGPPSTTAIGI